MSHFSLMLVLPTRPNGESIFEAMLPFHEYETTGINKYTKDIDVTEEQLYEYYLFTNNYSMKEAVNYLFEYLHPLTILQEKDITHTEEIYTFLCHKNNGTMRLMRRTNPNSKWDWYVLGGRWRGYFIRLKEECKSAPVYDETVFSFKKPNPHPVGVRKGDLDFQRRDDEARINLASDYDSVHNEIDSYIPDYKPLSHFKEKYPCNIKSKEMYGKQELCQVFTNVCRCQMRDLEDYLLPKDEFINKQVKYFYLPYAILKDGVFVNRDMLNMSRDEWSVYYEKILSEIPEDYWLVFIDCHI